MAWVASSNYLLKFDTTMSQYLKLSVLDLDLDDISRFKIELSNGISSASLDFYNYTDLFKDFAKDLILFPQNIADTIIYELGENDKKWAYHMFLKVYCFRENGHSAIRVEIDNHQHAPNTVKSEFFITTVPASINKLGQLLTDWNPEIDKELIWVAE